MANCYACKAEIVFDNEHIGKNGKKIPLDPATHSPHDCPMREKKPLGEKMSYGSFGGEEKDDHGNESFTSIPVAGDKPISPKEYVERLQDKYVDHTQQAKGQSKVKIFLSEIPMILEKEYNEFLAENNGKIKTQGAQFHISDRPTFAIALYYEEVTA